jgi:hypothetical protein
VAVRSLHLTDDDLWRAIADNTDAMSIIIEKQIELDARSGADPDTRQKLMHSNVQAIDNYNCQYRDYIAEVRRRYPSI